MMAQPGCVVSGQSAGLLPNHIYLRVFHGDDPPLPSGWAVRTEATHKLAVLTALSTFQTHMPSCDINPKPYFCIIQAVQWGQNSGLPLHCQILDLKAGSLLRDRPIRVTKVAVPGRGAAKTAGKTGRSNAKTHVTVGAERRLQKGKGNYCCRYLA